MSSAPIGVFDSGVGGLTVLKEIHRGLPHESTLYLGDSRHAPYGNLPAEIIRTYTLEGLDYLRDRGAKALVIACNSATSIALEAAQLRYDVPVIGVIEPTAREVATNGSRRIGVIGTEATVRSGQYSRAIKGLKPEAEVLEQACPRLAGLVEAGELDSVRMALALATYLLPLRRAKVDTIVLGCTHYPFLRAAIEQLVGSGLRLVESGPPLVTALRTLIDCGRLECAGGAGINHRLLTTGSASCFLRIVSTLWPAESPAIEEVDIEVSHGRIHREAA